MMIDRERLCMAACSRVPEPDCLIARSRRERRAVRREGDGIDVTAMALERLFMAACSRVPEPDCHIVRSRRERRAVRREGDGINITAMALERLQAGIPALSYTHYGLDKRESFHPMLLLYLGLRGTERKCRAISLQRGPFYGRPVIEYKP